MMIFTVPRLSSKIEHADMMAAGHTNTGASRITVVEARDDHSSLETSEQDIAVTTNSLNDRLLMGAILVVVSLVCVYAFTCIVPILIAHGY